MRVWLLCQQAVLTRPVSESAKCVFQNNVIFPASLKSSTTDNICVCVCVCVLWKQFVRWNHWLSTPSNYSEEDPGVAIENVLMCSENVIKWPVKQFIYQNVKVRGLWHWQVPPDKPDQHLSVAWRMSLFSALCRTDGFNYDIIIKNITGFSFSYAGSLMTLLMAESCQSFQPIWDAVQTLKGTWRFGCDTP